MNHRYLDHERLEVFQFSLRLVRWSQPILNDIPRGNAYIIDQFNRARFSIGLNIAEGSGERSPGEKARFYRIARRSATECAAALDMLHCLELIDKRARAEGHDLLVSITAMLTKLEESTRA
jgi:four helix bundle protein